MNKNENSRARLANINFAWQLLDRAAKVVKFCHDTYIVRLSRIIRRERVNPLAQSPQKADRMETINST